MRQACNGTLLGLKMTVLWGLPYYISGTRDNEGHTHRTVNKLGQVTRDGAKSREKSVGRKYLSFSLC